MHEGFVNFNAGTLGTSMVEGRISAGVVVDDGSDIGGGASIMGTLSGGGKEVISVGKRCLLGANSGLGISLGDDCVIEAGLYVTGGTKVHRRRQDGQGGELSGATTFCSDVIRCPGPSRSSSETAPASRSTKRCTPELGSFRGAHAHAGDVRVCSPTRRHSRAFCARSRGGEPRMSISPRRSVSVAGSGLGCRPPIRNATSRWRISDTVRIGTVGDQPFVGLHRGDVHGLALDMLRCVSRRDELSCDSTLRSGTPRRTVAAGILSIATPS